MRKPTMVHTFLIVTAALVFGLLLDGCAPRKESAPPSFAGRQACASCHEKEHRLWTGSDHALAMQEANDNTVLGNFDNATFTLLRDHLDVLQKGREVLRPHRRPRRDAPGVRDRLHLRGPAAPAVPGPLPPGAVPGPHHLLGHPAEGGRGPALVPPLPGRVHPPRRHPPLDEAVRDVELHVRPVPLDGPAEELRPVEGRLRHHLVRDRRLLRGVPRARVEPRRLGEGGEPGREGRPVERARGDPVRPGEGELGPRPGGPDRPPDRSPLLSRPDGHLLPLPCTGGTDPGSLDRRDAAPRRPHAPGAHPGALSSGRADPR